YQTMGIDAATLSKSVVHTYLNNYKIVEGLAQKYGFNFYFFWPPHISYGEKSLTAEEQELKRVLDPALVKLYLSTYETIKPLFPEYKNLSNLSDVFDEYGTLLWLDDAHVTPVGNQIVAQKMLEILTAQAVLNIDGSPTVGYADRSVAAESRQSLGIAAMR
ncbi:MAG: hypothetical protein ACREO5_10160, partial [Candidatus Binatia bacterium]